MALGVSDVVRPIRSHHRHLRVQPFEMRQPKENEFVEERFVTRSA